jgi:hypothetical protein
MDHSEVERLTEVLQQGFDVVDDPFRSAVRECISAGPEGKAILLAAIPTAPYLRKHLLLQAAMYFRTPDVAEMFRGIVLDQRCHIELRCLAISGLAAIDRPEDHLLFIELLAGRSSKLANAGLAACVTTHANVEPEVTLRLLERLSKRRTLDRDYGPPNPLMYIVALFASSATTNGVLGERFARLLRSIAPRIYGRDLQWLKTTWPELLEQNVPYHPLNERRRDSIAEEMDHLVKFYLPRI